jgi:hypothetical protein
LLACLPRIKKAFFAAILQLVLSVQRFVAPLAIQVFWFFRPVFCRWTS